MPGSGCPIAAAASIATLLDREAEPPRPLGRALDRGCGRGQYTLELARQGLRAVGIDYVSAAIEEAKRRSVTSVCYVVGDVTTRMRSFLGGASQEDVETAFPDGDTLAVEPAFTRAG